MKMITKDATETIALGEKIGEFLTTGDILILEGDLGAGKTTFTKGIAKGMGVEGYVKSPTFTYVIQYDGRVPLYHFDLYRLTEAEELYDLGFEDFIDQGVSVMEWGSLVIDLLKDEGLEYIKISLLKAGDNERQIIIEDTPKGQALYKELMK